MTSRQYTGRTGRTEGRAPRRGVVRRGILPSFGDIVLPIVSVAALGLLILAGRQFFLNGMKTSPGMSSTRAYAEAPALIAEREQKEQREQERREAAEAQAAAVTAVQEAVAVSAEIASKPEAKDDTSFAAVAEILAQPQTVQKVTVTSAPAPAPKKTASASTATSKKTTATPAKASASTTLPANKQWRVQVGAYGTKENAQKEANKIKKAGYKATVYSNPASKHFKVWVQGGANKASAEKVVNAMKKLGYKGPISFPPAK